MAHHWFKIRQQPKDLVLSRQFAYIYKHLISYDANKIDNQSCVPMVRDEVLAMKFTLYYV